ncbi:hypothetical protein FVEN_g6975 [Fusarium venenatum]|uniref:Uncharacterized protein n=1 Tax=Fusarium venenatum TaxID=56646 RepID=A0A2L2TEP6_9HYPO|nr:uncharacterized protein FVRRES_09529 [Fusarium venenatum]KAG8355054.1 hypothetical protein FVEN_g6975 [Fusarium venenatum]CEI69452.1 unnamed protein product [Fusarium venenatum]
MTLTKNQEKEIYLAYKGIFSKQYSHLRKLKGVQLRINNTLNQSVVQTVIRKYGKDEVVKNVRVLLEAQVFESEKMAETRFSLGEPSPPPTPEPDNYKPRVGQQKHIPEVVKELLQDPLDLGQKGVAFTNIDFLLGISPDPIKIEEPVKVEPEDDVQVSKVCDVSLAGVDERLSSTSHLHERESETLKDTTTLVSPITDKGNFTSVAALKGICLGSTLSPIVNTKSNVTVSPSSNGSGALLSSREYKIEWSQFLKLYTHINRPAPQSPINSQKNEEVLAANQADPPFKTQHLILKRMQTILEHACFDFAKENMPGILTTRQWDCPEAGELNIWVWQLRKRLDELKRRACSKGVEVSLKSVLDSISDIRHFAVHRQPIRGDHLALLSSHAVVFCTILEVPDTDALSTLQTVRDSVKTRLAELSDLKNGIYSKLDTALEGIAVRRAELDALEQKIIQDAHDKFESHRTIAWNQVDHLLPYRYNEPYTIRQSDIVLRHALRVFPSLILFLPTILICLLYCLAYFGFSF